MTVLGVLLLAAGVTLVAAEAPARAEDKGMSERKWTYNVNCHNCAVINTFECSALRECPYETRRCLTLSIRLNSRELLVYKNCTDNCTFMYQSLEPPPAPKALRVNSFYWVYCCGANKCNYGGPANLERDILPDEPIEEEIEGAVRLRGSEFLLSLASILLCRTLT